MVSTYLAYDLINRDMKSTLARVAKEQQVAREAAYYKENIGKVTNVEDFLEDDRLYQYAMTAHGLEDMIYAKGFMRKVLESDLSDADSYASRLTDDRYRNFAASFSFTGGGVPVAQSDTQIDEMIGLYTASVANVGDAIKEETRYYNVMIDRVKSVDELLNNDRMRAYVFTVFGIDENSYSRETVKQLMSSDLADNNSYINTVYGPRVDDLDQRIIAANTDITNANTQVTAYQAAMLEPGADTALLTAQIAEQRAIITKRTADVATYNTSLTTISSYYDIAAAFEFNADGSVTAGTSAQTAAMKDITNQAYTFKNPRVTPAAALLNQEYFEQKAATARSVEELFSDPFDSRIYDYIKTAFGLTSAAVVVSTVENILTSDRDPDNASSYVNQAGENKEKYKALMNAFNFKTDGTLDTGVNAQSAAQAELTKNYYMGAYNDKDDAADELAISQYKTAIEKVTSLADLMLSANSAAYNFALKAVGLDPKTESTLTIKNVLKSDLNDPKSYVYKLKDERYVALAKAFNFDAKGSITEPLSAQTSAIVTEISKDYIVQMTRFADKDDAKKLREDADKEAKYYQEEIVKIDKVSELLANRRLVDFVLVSKGIDPEDVTDDYIKNMFASDLDDPESFANTEADSRFAEVVGSFNFDVAGNLTLTAQAGIQQRGEVIETANRYLHMTLETQQGNENAGVRLALYFERMAGSITTAYDILGDTALLEVFRTTFSLPAELTSMDIDQQAKIVEKYMDLEDLKDPEKLSKFVRRFTILYDMENFNGQSPSLSLLIGGNSASISADTLMAISQLRTG